MSSAARARCISATFACPAVPRARRGAAPATRRQATGARRERRIPAGLRSASPRHVRVHLPRSASVRRESRSDAHLRSHWLHASTAACAAVLSRRVQHNTRTPQEPLVGLARGHSLALLSSGSAARHCMAFVFAAADWADRDAGHASLSTLADCFCSHWPGITGSWGGGRVAGRHG